MNLLNERYSDLVGDQDDPALLECIADLDATCAIFKLSPERDAALARSLTAQAVAQNRPIARTRPWRPTWRRAPLQAARWRLASMTLALLIAVGGIGAYFHGQGPTPVNAQTVLHRAAAATPGPNEATHSTYRLTASGGYTGTADVWVGTDASSAPSEFALTISMSRDGHPAPDLSSQRILTNQAMQVYDPAKNTITISSPTAYDQQLEGMFVAALVAQKVNRALAAGVQPSQFALQQQTLDGVSVYALRLDDGSDQTFYFNTQSYVLEGVDWIQDDGRAWQARLDPSSYHTMPLSAVPPHTFSLNAPPTARVVTHTSPARTSKSSGSGARPEDDIVSTAVAACKTTAQAFTAALQAGDKSMLAICQETNPGMTADGLIAALLAPFKSALDAQVASGDISAAEEATDLANIRMKITHMVTDQPGSTPGTKPGGK